MILCLIPFRIRFVLIVIVPLEWRFLHSEVLILRQKYKIQIRISEIQEITAFRDSKSGSFLSNSLKFIFHMDTVNYGTKLV